MLHPVYECLVFTSSNALRLLLSPKIINLFFQIIIYNSRGSRGDGDVDTIIGEVTIEDFWGNHDKNAVKLYGVMVTYFSFDSINIIDFRFIIKPFIRTLE